MKHTSTDNPNYYAVIPASVRYSKELASLDKLMYGEITCLTNYKGYCWATNHYFSNLYGRSKGTISRSINNLLNFNFIKITMIRDGNNVERRLIRIKEMGAVKNIKPPNQKSLGGVVKNDYYNTKKNNKKKNIKSNKSNVTKEKEVLFEEFWDAYDKKVGRMACKSKFLKLDIDTCKKCVKVAYKYAAATQDINFRKNPLTWLNQGCWDDEIIKDSKKGFTGAGFDNFVF